MKQLRLRTAQVRIVVAVIAKDPLLTVAAVHHPRVVPGEELQELEIALFRQASAYKTRPFPCLSGHFGLRFHRFSSLLTPFLMGFHGLLEDFHRRSSLKEAKGLQDVDRLLGPQVVAAALCGTAQLAQAPLPHHKLEVLP